VIDDPKLHLSRGIQDPQPDAQINLVQLRELSAWGAKNHVPRGQRCARTAQTLVC